jgi:hypothetical protein
MPRRRLKVQAEVACLLRGEQRTARMDGLATLPARAVARLQRSFAKHSFVQMAKGVLNTPPLRILGEAPLFLSMLPRRDLLAYLLAIKSLYAEIGQGRVAIINERGVIDHSSLTESDLAVLRYHIPGIEIIDFCTISTGRCPRGGTWERLVKIIEFSKENYVIQVDADTLVSAPIPEVLSCVRANRSFILGTGSGRAVLPAPETARMVQGWIKTYGWTEPSVCVAAEAALDRLPNAANKSYVHASSGFAGFARGAFSLDELESFSMQMDKLIGLIWQEKWGSEQIGSNYTLANASDPVVLPYPRYATFEPHLPPGEHAFLHYIGECRYNYGVYRKQAGKFISRYNMAV